ncbi:MAG: Fe(2+) transporter permease subunit FeoB [Zoogloeaceae bacterium]|jgi:ferrous iron transport protein B|nr:Fe(2+) transporter permease subunit FeoB [Zoogloeaceae bacterium]
MTQPKSNDKAVPMAKLTLGLVGNPNCGKTTLFNALTGARQKVGNWPGVTVEKKSGFFTHRDKTIEVIDLPGAYTLDLADTSPDEEVARSFVLSRQADLIINIVDASNLERNLYLTSQLMEMRVPMVVALNMVDVARSRGIEIDCDKLAQKLGCPVLPVVASKSNGVEAVKDFLALNTQFALPGAGPAYPEALEQAVEALAPKLKLVVGNMEPRWVALKAMEGDETVLKRLAIDAIASEEIRQQRAQVEEALDEETDIVVADARYGFIGEVVETAVTSRQRKMQTLSDKIDRVVLNRVLGIPVFFLMMYLMFLFTINIGGAFIDFFDGAFGAIFVDGLGHVLEGIGAPQWLTVLLANGLGGGIQTVSTFVPVIAFLFLFLSYLEDSGYMARAAFVVDRFMRFIGLPGKAFVPMIVGFGCNVPAAMATRTLEHERERKMTMAMVPFMSCGARMPVYALFAVAFFPQGGQNLVFLLYILGIVAAVFTGLVLKHTLLPGQSAPFVMELPPYHLPSLKTVLIHTWHRLSGFILKAGKIIVPMVLVLNVLNAVGTDGSFGHEDTEESALSAIGRTITPVFEPMGLTRDNWPAAVGIFTGVLAKEAVVGTLNALYAGVGEADAKAAGNDAGKADEEEEAFDFWGALKDAVATIPKNFADIKDSLFDPMKISVGDIEDRQTAAEEQEVSVSTYDAMARLFPSQIAAFSYLALILLYFPCVAVLGAIYREAGGRWTAFVSSWGISLGYSVSVLSYQLGTFAEHPGQSLGWCAAIAAVGGLAMFLMRRHGKKMLEAPRTASLSPMAAV